MEVTHQWTRNNELEIDFVDLQSIRRFALFVQIIYMPLTSEFNMGGFLYVGQ